MSKKINVNGIAIREGVSRNGVLYSKEELAKFAPTLANKPILKDHKSEVDSTVGLVTASESIDNGSSVNYTGWVKEDATKVVEKIEDERIKEVSIGAIVGRLVKESEDSDVMIAKDIRGMELSLTPTPGVQGTSIMQSFKIDESTGKQIQKNIIVESFSEEKEEKEEDKSQEDSEVEEFQSQSSEYSDKELNYRRLKNMTEGKENVTETNVTQEEFTALKEEMASIKEERVADLTKKYSKLCEKMKITEKKSLTYEALKVIVESLEEVDEQPVEEAEESTEEAEAESKEDETVEAEEEKSEESEETEEKAEESEDNEPDTKSEVTSEETSESIDSNYVLESADKVGMSFYKK